MNGAYLQTVLLLIYCLSVWLWACELSFYSSTLAFI
jgi:hypothetical protein